MLQEDITQPVTDMVHTSTLQQPDADWSVWTLCADGDYFMLPILLLLLIVLYVFCERAYFILKAARYNDVLLHRIKDYIHENEVESAENLCRADATPSGSVLRAGLELLGHHPSDIRTAMSLKADIECNKLKSLTGWLPFVAAAAPLAGLLGSMTGLLRTVFDNPGLASNSPVLYTPFMTLIVGVIVGLVALCAHYFLASKLTRTKLVLESVIEYFMKVLNEPSV